MSHQMEWGNINQLGERKKKGSQDEIKFVLSSEDDFHWAIKIINTHKLLEVAPVIFSPVGVLFSPGRLAELILEHQLSVRLQLQLHTILWPDISRGV